jgi:uncharacterized protein YjbJ (UPF0337 family)
VSTQLIGKERSAVTLQDKIANKARVLKGKAKEAVGRATRNPELEMKGRLGQGIGRLREAGQKIKQSGRDIFGR